MIAPETRPDPSGINSQNNNAQKKHPAGIQAGCLRFGIFGFPLGLPELSPIARAIWLNILRPQQLKSLHGYNRAFIDAAKGYSLRLYETCFLLAVARSTLRRSEEKNAGQQRRNSQNHPGYRKYAEPEDKKTDGHDQEGNTNSHSRGLFDEAVFTRHFQPLS